MDSADAVGFAKVFKALGDPVRLQLYSLIASRDEPVCVCDLLASFELTAPTISHHLKSLRIAGLIDSERRGTWVYYWPVDEARQRVASLLGSREVLSAP
ncbi:ArsR family transcriptional regulator [Antricoccus suffuscus]|uniref:ArsR family transcriptional regulator n=1 Tax=Antricoccus suffuscus TaxID=1629062 RepID=A0A2T0ZZA4_9ACTN|nr:metalloregulator ArsR/SmtB family transcription factor [Antricoccus suffuscus]PRZ41567.1 ArsR family transcriptional regulator [Antricoccus suffuscus]